MEVYTKSVVAKIKNLVVMYQHLPWKNVSFYGNY